VEVLIDSGLNDFCSTASTWDLDSCGTGRCLDESSWHDTNVGNDCSDSGLSWTVLQDCKGCGDNCDDCNPASPTAVELHRGPQYTARPTTEYSGHGFQSLGSFPVVNEPFESKIYIFKNCQIEALN
jgi:hypothetical protein